MLLQAAREFEPQSCQSRFALGHTVLPVGGMRPVDVPGFILWCLFLLFVHVVAGRELCFALFVGSS